MKTSVARRYFLANGLSKPVEHAKKPKTVNNI